MQLPHTFHKLPFHFDVDRLRAETVQFAPDDWRPHPQGFAGNDALILISVDGGQNDEFVGPMQPTNFLDRCPYFQQVMDQFDTVVGRSRLMRLAGGEQVSSHYDLHYNWYNRVRIHVPIVTDPAVRFLCGDDEVHMQPGEAWIFDTWQFHNVINDGNHDRVHLVIDTTGSSSFWNLLNRSWKPGDDPEARLAAEFVAFKPDAPRTLRFERHNAAAIDPPSVMDHKLYEFQQDLGGLATSQPEVFAALAARFTAHCQDWRCCWAEHGESASAIGPLQQLNKQTLDQCLTLLKDVTLDSNGAPAAPQLQNWLFSAVRPAVLSRNAAALSQPVNEPSRPAAAPVAASFAHPQTPASLVVSQPAVSGLTLGQVRHGATAPTEPQKVMAFQRPVFIVAAPRSGSTMLFEALCTNAAIWSTAGESHQTFESIPELNIAAHSFDSNALSAADASPEVVRQLKLGFLNQFQDAVGGRRPQTLRFLEKTPKNALRIPFLRAAFPDAIFVHLVREPRSNLGSIIDAWQSGKFVTYPDLPGWSGPPWSLLLIPGWRELADRPLTEIAAAQWAAANQAICDGLSDLPADRKCQVQYEDLLANQAGELRRLCEFAGIPFGPRMQQLCAGELPLSRYTLSRPNADKWRRHEATIEAAMPSLASISDRLGFISSSAG